jgi:pyruvate dehydrogenase E2 component (dihydrolipoamide acetyltransferase)
MEEGALGGWLKHEGDYVNAGDLLFTVEGDKAVQEIEALDSGFLKFAPAAPPPGKKVPVGTLLGYLVSKEELSSFGQSRPPAVQAEPAAETQVTTPKQAPSQPQAIASKADERQRRIYISPYARRLAEGLGVSWQQVKGSGGMGALWPGMCRSRQNSKSRKSPCGCSILHRLSLPGSLRPPADDTGTP